MTMFQIKNRWSGAVQFETELSAEIAGKKYKFQLGFAVKKAVEARADLAGADLARADLAGADLAGANLARADLAGANLAGANLARANLARANLARANLAGANPERADLVGADLAGAKLTEHLILVGNRPVLTIGQLGSERRTIFIWLTDKGVYVRAGCFFDTYSQFQAKVQETHGDNEHGREYRACYPLIDAHAALWMPEPAPVAEPALYEALSGLLNCVDGQHDYEWLGRCKSDALAALGAARGETP